MSDFFTLLKKGFLAAENLTIKQTLILGVTLYFLLTIFKFLLFFLGFYFFELEDLPKPIYNEFFTNRTELEKLFFIAILGPISEELSFRLGLIFSKLNFSILVSGIMYYVLAICTDINWIIGLYLWLISGFLVYFSISISSSTVVKLSSFWSENRLEIFYMLLLIFSILHLWNYEWNLRFWKYSLLLIVPHVIGGFFYSYARFKKGILFSICLHICNNGLLKSILMIVES